jgi:hypothetical protein
MVNLRWTGWLRTSPTAPWRAVAQGPTLACTHRHLLEVEQQMLGRIGNGVNRFINRGGCPGEYAANTERKDFTPSEAVAIGKAVEELERKKAKERQATSTGGSSPCLKPASGTVPQAEIGRVRDKIGAAVGMSGRASGNLSPRLHGPGPRQGRRRRWHVREN